MMLSISDIDSLASSSRAFCRPTTALLPLSCCTLGSWRALLLLPCAWWWAAIDIAAGGQQDKLASSPIDLPLHHRLQIRHHFHIPAKVNARKRSRHLACRTRKTLMGKSRGRRQICRATDSFQDIEFGDTGHHSDLKTERSVKSCLAIAHLATQGMQEIWRHPMTNHTLSSIWSA